MTIRTTHHSRTRSSYLVTLVKSYSPVLTLI